MSTQLNNLEYTKMANDLLPEYEQVQVYKDTFDLLVFVYRISHFLCWPSVFDKQATDGLVPQFQRQIILLQHQDVRQACSSVLRFLTKKAEV